MDQLSGSFPTYEVQEPLESSFEYKVKVNKDGDPYRAVIVEDVPEVIQKPFHAILNNIGNYVPSFVNGEYIEDELTVTGKVSISTDGKVSFHSIHIQRAIEE